MWAAERQLPVWLSALALIFLAAIALLRIARVHATLPDRLMNTTVSLGVISMVLHEPEVALRVAPLVPGGLSTVFDVWHWLYVLACTVGAGIWTMRRWGPERFRRPFRAMIVAAFALGAIFLFLSAPARQQHLGSIAEVGGIRYAAYFVAYAIFLTALCLWLLPPINQMRAEAATWRDRAVANIVLVGVLILGTANSIFIAGGAICDAYHVDVWLAHVGRNSSAGSTLLPITVLACLSLLPSAVRAAWQILRLDRQSRAARRLRPVWQDITAAVPHVRLHQQLSWINRIGSTPAERLLRRGVEIIDAAKIYNDHAEALPAFVDDLIEARYTDEGERADMQTVTELVIASLKVRHEGGVSEAAPSDSWAPPLPSWELLARLWPEATALVSEAFSRQASKACSAPTLIDHERIPDVTASACEKS